MKTTNYGTVEVAKRQSCPLSVETTTANANSVALAWSWFVDVDVDPLVVLWHDR